MVRLELDQVVMRRMKEDDIEVVKALIKVCKIEVDKILGRLLSSWWEFALVLVKLLLIFL